MREQKSLLDLLEELVDKARYHIETVVDDLGEGLSDLRTTTVQFVAGLFGRSVIHVTELLVPSSEQPRAAALRWIAVPIGLLIAFLLWLTVLLVSWFISVGAAVFGLRRGKEYPFSEILFIWGPLIVLGLAVPFIGFKDFGLSQFVVIYAFSLIVLGLNVLIGIAGQHSIGHAAFALIGGYFTVLLFNGDLVGIKFDPFTSLLLAGIASAAVGAALAVPAVRVKGPYLSLVTLGLMHSISSIIKSKPLRGYTNGVEGLSFDQPTPPALFKFISQSAWVYYIAFLCFIVLFSAAHVLIRRGKVGRAFTAIKDGEEKSNVLGINVPLYKASAFALSAFYAGIGGGLISFNTGFIAGTSFTIKDSMDYLVAVFIGGSGTVFGSVIGGAFLAFRVFIVELLSKSIKNGDQLLWAFYGGILVFVLLVAPKGIAGEIGSWLYGKFSTIPRRRHHRRSPFPDYDLDEELIASSPDPVVEPAPSPN